MDDAFDLKGESNLIKAQDGLVCNPNPKLYLNYHELIDFRIVKIMIEHFERSSIRRGGSLKKFSFRSSNISCSTRVPLPKYTRIVEIASACVEIVAVEDGDDANPFRPETTECGRESSPKMSSPHGAPSFPHEDLSFPHRL